MRDMERRHESRLKATRLLSSLGALVLGTGIGLLLPDAAGGLGPVVLVVGALAHAWGMRETHRVERDAGLEPPAWSEALYRACWVALAALTVLLLARRAGLF